MAWTCLRRMREVRNNEKEEAEVQQGHCRRQRTFHDGKSGLVGRVTANGCSETVARATGNDAQRHLHSFLPIGPSEKSIDHCAHNSTIP
jgi:hypothetical protein